MTAKYEVGISYGSKVIAKVKVDNRQTDKQTDRQTDRQRGQKQYAPDHSIRGHKNVVEVVPKGQEGQGFYSTFFIVQKKDGSYRPILNLRNLNTHLQVPHFKMKTLK